MSQQNAAANRMPAIDEQQHNENIVTNLFVQNTFLLNHEKNKEQKIAQFHRFRNVCAQKEHY